MPIRNESLYENKPDFNRLNAFYLAVGVVDANSKDGREFHYEDPSTSLMTALGARPIPIKKFSLCETSTGRCRDRATGQPGHILRVGPIKWIYSKTAILDAGHYEHGLGASGDETKVHREGGQWKVTYTGKHWVS